MKMKNAGLLLLAVFGILFFAPAALTSQEAGGGVIVVKVAKGSIAEKVGLKRGDLLLTWDHNGTPEKIETPFDLTSLETEFSPLDPVTISGVRGAENLHWVLGDGAWNMKVRPSLSGDLLAAYQQATDAAPEAGKVPDAARQLRELAMNSQFPSWLRAWLLLSHAQVLGAAENWDQADQSCQQAIHEAGSVFSQRVSLLRACGEVFYLREDKQVRAKKYFQQALEESKNANPRSLTVAAILNSIGRIHYGMDELKPAIEFLSQTVDIQKELAPGSLTLAFSYNRIGVFFQDSGELDQARENMERSLAIREKLMPDTVVLGNTLENLGNVMTMRGDLDKSESLNLRALSLMEKLAPESLYVAGSLNDLAFVYQSRGELRKAEEYRLRALQIQKKLNPEGHGAAVSLNNLGLIAQQRGQLSEAEDYYTQSLALKSKSAPDSLDVASTLANLGSVARARGNLAQADEVFHKALAIDERVAPTAVNTGVLYEEICELKLEQDELAAAEEYCQKALTVAQATAAEGLEVANVLSDLAEIEIRHANWSSAEGYLKHTLKIYETRAAGNIGHGQTLLALGEVCKHQQKPEEAAQMFQRGLAVLENDSGQVGGGEAAQAAFRARFENHYASYVDLLVAQGKPELAFEVLERTRARSLLEMLSAAKIDVRKGTDPALISHEKSLQALIAAKSNARLNLLGSPQSEAQVAVMDEELKGLLRDYREVEQQLRERSPDYAALTQPQALTLSEVQHQLLDSGTVLLEYSLSDERSNVFVIGANSFKVYPLPTRAKVEELARETYESLTARNQSGAGETPDQQRVRSGKADQEYKVRASRLSEMVLAPLAKDIAGKRLLFVADGALQYIPFAALPEPQPGSVPRSPLMQAHVIVNLPSIAVLKVLRKEEAGRRQPAKTVAVLADPVFAADDGRLAATSKPNSAAAPTAQRSGSDTDEMLTRSIRDVGLLHLSRLPYTRKEADAILSMSPPKSSMRALDFNASRAKALDPDLGNYKLVHFATHGLIDNQHPELSGLVFSLLNEQGKPVEGFLPLEDIYNLNLPIDMVVLSACETGLGKEISGEGLLGLMRGFMYAGATRVVASLWKVNDVATAELMRRFYRGMLHDHLPAAAALRQAQLQMLQTRWSSPYYWAAFQLHGEWK